MSEPVNAALFRGEIRAYWRLIARGADKRSIQFRRRRGGGGFDFGLDEQGLARRDGGIVSPIDRTLGAGIWLYRFVGTVAFSRYGSSAMLGGWWIDQDTWQLLCQTSAAQGLTLPQCAQIHLALPDEWGDRGRLARGRLAAPVMAWCGQGAVAHGARGDRVTPAQHNKAVQLFLPGEPDLIGRAFGGVDRVECLYTRDVPRAW